MSLTVRSRILDALLLRLQELPADKDGNEGTADSYEPIRFSKVELGPLDTSDHKKRYTAGVVPGEEKKKTRFPITDCTLPVTVEVRMTVNQGDKTPGEEMEILIAAVQRKICEDRTFGGIAIDCTEIGNAVDLDTYEDKSAVGAVFFEIQYRHATNDPRKPL